VTGKRGKINRAYYAVTVLVLVMVALYFSDELRFYRLSVTIPEEGLTYDFNNGAFQEWVSTSEYITVEKGRVKASASGSGGTQTYSCDFNNGNLGGWEILHDSAANHGYYGESVGEIREDALYLKAKYVWILSYPSWAYAWAKQEFDFTGCESVSATLIYTSRKAIIKAYKSVDGRQGDFITSWSIPNQAAWTETLIDLSAVADHKVFLYFGVDCSETTVREPDEKYLWISSLAIEAVKPAFSTEGYLEQEFSFTKGFSDATIQAISLEVDYASESSWNGFWGVRLLEGGVELGSWQFSKGYMAWNTFKQDIKSHVAGRTVKVQVGGTIYSGVAWYLDNIRIRYVLQYPFITVNLQSSYPANAWVEIPVTLGVKKSGLLVTAEIQDRGFEGITDSSGVAKVKVQTPTAGSYQITFFATDPSDGVRHTVNETLNVLPILKATISAEASQHYDTSITFTVTTVDPDKNLRIDTDALNVQVVKDAEEVATTIEKMGTGEYLVSFTVDSAGTAKVTVDPRKTGYYSQSDECEITILDPKIVLTVNIPAEVEVGGQADLYMKTTNPEGEPVDADTIAVYLTDPTGDTEGLQSSRVTKGTYLVTPTFMKEGLYRVEVKASDSVYGSSSATYTIKAVSRGPFDQIPNSSLLILGGVAAAVAVAILVIRRKQHK